jgi:hypothetical protein
MIVEMRWMTRAVCLVGKAQVNLGAESGWPER